MDKNKFIIPEELKTFEQEIDYSFENFERGHTALNALEISGAEQVVICGGWLNLSKTVVKKHKKGNWIPYFEKRFPHIKVRKAQHYMRAARQTNLEETPALACMGKTALCKLTAMAGKEDLASYLTSCGYDLKIDPKDKEAIEDMKGALQEYIDFCESLSPSEPRKFRRDKGQKDTEKDNETKAKSKPDNTNIIDKVNRSAASFIKNLDLVLKDKKAFRSNEDELGEIIKNVEEKLAALKNSKNQLNIKKLLNAGNR